MIYFVDTNALLSLIGHGYDFGDTHIIISLTTLIELENIKTSGRKDDSTKYNARVVLRWLTDHIYDYAVAPHSKEAFDDLVRLGYPASPDTQIIADALNILPSNPDLLFVTNDRACYQLALGADLPVATSESMLKVKKPYTGVMEVKLTDTELAEFYNEWVGNNINRLGLISNQYLIIRDENDKLLDVYRWDKGYYEVRYPEWNTQMFGKIKPLHNDIYQRCAMDSIENNQFTILTGKAGSGKSMLGLGGMFHLLDRGDIDRIMIFANTVATKGSARLGFYPGSRQDKLLDSQIGNFLIGKFGSRIEIDRWVEDGTLEILPFADIRGYDLDGKRAGLYITEGQNTTTDMMKLALQRAGKDTKIIIEGDYNAQVDMDIYENGNNGLRRAIEVFKGEDYFGYINLQQVHRSRITEKAEAM